MEDNGPGLVPCDAMQARKSIGLRNVRDRLEQLYSSEYEFELRPGDPCGGRATIVIPGSGSILTANAEQKVV